MAALDQAGSLAVQLEKTRNKVPLMFNRDSPFFGKVEKREVEKVSSKAMRLPQKMKPGGRAKQVDFNGGNLGRGGAGKWEASTVQPIDFVFAVEINLRAEWATNSQERAVDNVVKQAAADGMAQFRTFLDKYCMTSGNGVLATMSSGQGGTTWVLATPFGSRRLYVGQRVATYDTTLATKRAEEVEILTIDDDIATVTVSGTVTSMAATDVLMPEGITGATPTGLFGLYYFNSNANTGTLLGLNRANFPEIRCPRVNGNAAALTTVPIRLLLNKIRMALGVENDGKGMFFMHVAQEDAWEKLGIQATQIIKKSGDNQGVDMMFTGKNQIAGYTIQNSIYADSTRIDFVDFSHWGRGELKEIDYLKIGNDTMFPVYDVTATTGGGLVAAYLFYYAASFQLWNDSPRSSAYCDNLQVPAGYPG